MESFQSISQDVFREFVRSAVIIDDHWPEGEIIIDDDSTGERDLLAGEVSDSEIAISDAELSSEAAVPSAANIDEVDAEMLGKLRHILLRKGILACGLRYQQTDRQLAVKLASRADIVVLDWHLVNDDGAEALEILSKLKGHCLRFICIWTGYGQAEVVRERLIRALGSPGKVIDGRNKVDLRLDNLVIAIRIKKGLEPDSDLSVGPERLLDMAVEGLTSSFGGLVQLAMLEMMNKHREHLPEILDDIGDSIDTAVLLEAADKKSPIGPGGAFLAVLVDEWRSRLEGDSGKLKVLSPEGRKAFGSFLVKSQGEDWLDKLKEALGALGANSDMIRQASAIERAEVCKWLESGCAEQLPSVAGLSPDILAWAVLQSTSDKGLEPLFRLESLLHQQFDAPISLTQGTILRVEQGTNSLFLLCTTPLCDVARPEKVGNLFTFVRSRVVPSAKVLQGGWSDNYCVVRGANESLCLSFLVRERISLIISDAKFNENLVVQGRFSLGDEGVGEAINLHFVAQLRSEHALSLAASSAAENSRIGVNKVELIRKRIAKKKN